MVRRPLARRTGSIHTDDVRRVAAADRVLWTLWGAGWGIVYVVYFTLMGW